jgi:hypothetical protein
MLSAFRMSFVAFALALSPLPAADKKVDKVKMDDEVKNSTARALEWLASKQNSNGSWSDPAYPHNTAITGYALMAFMSQGHVPNQGKYGPEVAKGCRFLMASQREDGYLVSPQGLSNMYCHGMAALALSQLWGMTGDDELKKCLEKAIKLIVKCQSPDGGWRYNPVPADSDISATIMQVMALRGAKDGGIHVPDKTMIRALKYIDSCYDRGTSGYTYQPNNRAPGFARTAAGICLLKLLGEMEFYDQDRQRKIKVLDEYGRNLEASVQYLKQQMALPREHFWYGHYYACHAMHQVGGTDWEDYYAAIKKKFLDMQSKDGFWRTPDHNTGAIYQTSIAVIALSIPANYLPIFQR